jgi:vanillate O-demethylase ferredoxin subunit
MQGICGACETRVLSEVERASNRCMMLCCSGARSPTLRLDL